MAVATTAELLEPFLRVVLTYASKKREGKFCGEAGTGYLSSGSNNVKLWRQ